MRNRLIVGLGNPGEKYLHSRHNAGFIVLDKIVDSGVWKEKKDFQAIIAEQVSEEVKTIFIKPQTYMNASGDAVSKVANFYKIPPEDILVIHDELDIDFGGIRVKHGGGSAGHNGVQSVIQHIGEDFERIRIGIKNELSSAVEADKFVLSNFSKDEYEKLTNRLVNEIKFLI